MAELKTKLTGASVSAFLKSIENEQIRKDSQEIVKIFGDITKAKAEMWGPGIIGFGRTQYRYPDGRSMEWMKAAFAPRKRNIVIYITPGFDDYEDLLSKLGKHSRGKVCLYINKLSDVHLATLKKIVKASLARDNKLEREYRSKETKARKASKG